VAGRVFTLEQALELLPVVSRLLVEAQSQKRELEQRSADLDRLLGLTAGNGHLKQDISEARSRVEATGTKMQKLLDEFEELGVELKGIEEGLLDFPSEREGRIVYLCWRLGEETISYWHELHTGFAGRQPL
jgi:hypothetical protein